MADIHHIQRILLIIESIQTELFCSRSSFSPIVSRLSRLHHSNLVTVYVGMCFSFGCRSGHLACLRRTDGMDGRDSSSVAHTDRNVLVHMSRTNLCPSCHAGIGIEMINAVSLIKFIH
jgi:hypothetical protein